MWSVRTDATFTICYVFKFDTSLSKWLTLSLTVRSLALKVAAHTYTHALIQHRCRLYSYSKRQEVCEPHKFQSVWCAVTIVPYNISLTQYVEDIGSKIVNWLPLCQYGIIFFYIYSEKKIYFNLPNEKTM